jgi:hypothetical protein
MMLEMPEKSVMLLVARSLAAASYRILAITFFAEMALSVTGSEEQDAGIILAFHIVPF